MPRLLAIAICTLAAAGAIAQSNSRGPGYDGRVTDLASPRYWGRRGPGHPNGELGLSFAVGVCNPGVLPIAWQPTTPTLSPMQPDHPGLAFLVVRELDGRLVQVSSRSFCLHAPIAVETTGPCGSCGSPGTGTTLGAGCSHLESATATGNRLYLAPTAEVDPWLCTWNPVASYFDRGDPAVPGLAAMDGLRSLTGSQVSAFDAVKNRVAIREADLLAIGGPLFAQTQLVLQGEPVANRQDNLMSRPFTAIWTGSSWNLTATGAPSHGSVLARWTGATLGEGRNGTDDGRFVIAAKVTALGGGMWRYAYAIHNVDAARGGAALRVPVPTSAVVANAWFRDADPNGLNDWTFTRVGAECTFAAAADNPLDWNHVYAASFDCNSPPGPATLLVDMARVGPGALTIGVPSQAPSDCGVCFCTSGAVANGSFAGAIAGQMPTGSVGGWSIATGTPTVVAAAGCSTPGAIRLRGSLRTGDAVRTAATLVAGRTYRITFCHRWVADGSSTQTTARVRVSASPSSSPTAWPPTATTYATMATATSSTGTWATHTDHWIASATAASVVVDVENDLDSGAAVDLSWGEVDDLCIVEVPHCAAFVFDRSDEMAMLQSSGQSRAQAAIDAASALGGNVDHFFAEHPLGVALVYEFLGTSVRRIGGSTAAYTDAAATKAAIASLSPLLSGKPLAAALCAATGGLVALDPAAEPWLRHLWLYCCGGDDGSDPISCRGTLPEAAMGNRCPQAPPDPDHRDAFSVGSWQEAVCNVVHAGVQVQAYYWDDFALVPTLAETVAALCDATGGTFTRVWDQSGAPAVNPWRTAGVGCADFLGTRLSMHHDGIPRLGNPIAIRCRSSVTLPVVLGVGLQDTTIGGQPLPIDLSGYGAPGCRIYSSWDATDSVLPWHGSRLLAIPTSLALAGLTLHWQGLQPHAQNNRLGMATSNLLAVTIVP
jgi:hypothetical protein